MEKHCRVDELDGGMQAKDAAYSKSIQANGAHAAAAPSPARSCGMEGLLFFSFFFLSP